MGLELKVWIKVKFRVGPWTLGTVTENWTFPLDAFQAVIQQPFVAKPGTLVNVDGWRGIWLIVKVAAKG